MKGPLSRREFLIHAGGAAAAATVAGSLLSAATGPATTQGAKPMKAIDVVEFFIARASWIKRDQTVDRVIVGDPNKSVRRVLVTWMPSLAAVHAAIDGRYDMIVAHEPTFYDHRDYRDNPQDLSKAEIAVQKKKLIEDSGLVIVRNHDAWDLFPDVGIPFAWAKHLGFTSKPVTLAGGNYLHRYDIEPTTVGELSKRIAGRVALLGEDAVQVFGPADKVVSKIGVGTGCACNPTTFQYIGCDFSIVSDDGTAYWRELQRAQDEGHPFVRIHHGTSEEPGMVTLTDYINANIPGIEATHLPHRPFYRTIRA